jgi:hypothetical protein
LWVGDDRGDNPLDFLRVLPLSARDSILDRAGLAAVLLDWNGLDAVEAGGEVHGDHGADFVIDDPARSLRGAVVAFDDREFVRHGPPMQHT